MFLLFKIIFISILLFLVLVVFFLSLQAVTLRIQKQVSLITSLVIFLLTISLFCIYVNDSNVGLVKFNWMCETHSFLAMTMPSISFFFFFDYLNLNLLILTSFIFCLVIYYLNNTVFTKYNYCAILIFSLWAILILLFCTANLLFFYFLFELSLIPMFFIIGIFGNRLRKVHAAVFFIMYTSVLSFFFLLLLLILYYWLGTFDYFLIRSELFVYYFQIMSNKFDVFWCLAIIAFFAKLPIFPFHIWLPEAHVEAPTIGSVILASILLKVGAYAIIRFVLPFANLSKYRFFGISNIHYLVIVKTLLWISLFYSTVIVISQVDLKKIIAYSSIIHMSLGMLGFFSHTVYGAYGGYLMLFAHGFSSAGLFFIAGMLYSRFGTRLLKYYSGIHTVAPRLSFFAFFFFLANIGFPGTLNFISEFLIFIGIIHTWSFFFILIFGFCFVTSILYSIWIYNKIFLGTFNTDIFEYYYDLLDYERNILAILMFVTIFFGIFPNFIL